MPLNTHAHSVLIVNGSDLLGYAITQSLLPLGFRIHGSSEGAQPALSSADLLLLDDFASVPELRSGMGRMPKVIRLSACITPCWVHQAIHQGAKGYLYLGDTLLERLPQAVRDVLAGGLYLSPSASAALSEYQYFLPYVQRITAYHRQVIDQMAQYRPAGQIAVRLGRTTQAIYQVQRYLREQFEAETNGALLDRLAALGLIQRPAHPVAAGELSSLISTF